ncbi:NAD(P)/FAD-dependent oxidoreductase [Streptomyces sp. NPDC091217]|uniref:NAD(P)/FAD-dependent oxidoreductase n=1 Tax=Streptomyces sp. NPDC091217 TaxID=3365975 RepID=UPI003815F004
MSRLDRVVVVGASVAGVRTAEALRERGFAGELILVDKEKEYPYNRPPLSKEFLLGQLEEDDIRLLTQDMADDLHIDLRLGVEARGLRLGDRAVDTDCGAVGFDALVIATGGGPIIPPGWVDLEGVTALRTLDDARMIQRALQAGTPRAVVVGGGFIGCEIAASLRSLGAGEVTIVEAAPSLLSRALDPSVAERVAQLHRDRDVDVRCGTGVARMLGHGRVEAVELTDGARIDADLVVVGLGARPATSWLENSGLTIRDGVCADATLRAAPDVYAVGDIVRYADAVAPGGRRVEHWTSAREHGVIAAGNLLAPAQPQAVAGPAFVWSDQYERRIQIIGDGRGEQVRFVECDEAGDGCLALVGGPARVTGAIALDRPKQFRRARRLVDAGADWTAVGELRW